MRTESEPRVVLMRIARLSSLHFFQQRLERLE